MTEAERIEGMEDVQLRQRNMVAKRILSDGDEDYKIKSIVKLLAENSHLQQLIKEQKESTADLLKKLDDIAQEKEIKLFQLEGKLKSAQELNRELKAELKTYLPEDCINGIERKFCHFRNGDGWKCKQCAE